jgi:hypothetical protein
MGHIVTERDDAAPSGVDIEPTLSERVVARVGAGWSDRAIADDLGMTVSDLRKHFADELKHGRERLQGIMLDQLLRRMKEGSVTAISKMRDMTGVFPDVSSAAVAGVVSAPLGKKASRSLGAAVAIMGDADLRPN